MAAQSHLCQLPILQEKRDLVTRPIKPDDVQRLVAHIAFSRATGRHTFVFRPRFVFTLQPAQSRPNFPAFDQVSQGQLHDQCEFDRRLRCALGAVHDSSVLCCAQAGFHAASTPGCCNQGLREHKLKLCNRLESCSMIHIVERLLHVQLHHTQFISAILEKTLPLSAAKRNQHLRASSGRERLEPNTVPLSLSLSWSRGLSLS